MEEIKKITPEEMKERRRMYLQNYINKNYGGDAELWKYHQCQKKLHKYYTNEEFKKNLNQKRKDYYKANKKPKEPKIKVKTEKQLQLDEKLKQLKVI